MKDEYWATFSIYDHRTSLYRQALVLFDRIVVPVPTRPFGGVTNQEIDRLSKEVETLEDADAAKRVDWDPDEFFRYRTREEQTQPGHQEAVARRLVEDPPYLTRLQLKEQTEQDVAALLPAGALSVTAVPVYGTREAYEVSTADLKQYVQERLTLEVVMSAIPVPSEIASFDDILDIRSKPSFQASLAALRKWQRQTVREILLDEDEAGIRRATVEFAEMVRKYEEALSEARYEKVKTAICMMLGFGAAFSAVGGPVLGTLAGVASPLFSIKKLSKPCWKELEEKQCFPAGVVYEAQMLRGRAG